MGGVGGWGGVGWGCGVLGGGGSAGWGVGGGGGAGRQKLPTEDILNVHRTVSDRKRSNFSLAGK